MAKKKTKKSNETKKLEDENKSLKKKLAEVLNYVQDLQQKKEGGEFTNLAIGCSRNEDGKLCLDFVKYNPKTKEGLVEEQKELKLQTYHSLSLELGRTAELDVIKNIEEE